MTKTMLAVDFGSTFTKVTAIDITGRQILGVAKSFTTIDTDVCQGLNNALAMLKDQCGTIDFDYKMASSSAAGGLKMISCGFVPDLTTKASKLAAASAGAKVLKTYSYELSPYELEEIQALSPDIILLTGGIDGGNKAVLLHNANMLATLPGHFAVIVAGNKTAAHQVGEILEAAGKDAILCENVMPQFNKLNIMPAKTAIRKLFIKNIIEAKGLNDAQVQMSESIIPTPLAVFEAAELLAKGTDKTAGMGNLMAYDVGGATTDVYSMAAGTPSRATVVMKGLPEPFAKRTVEGDIGVRYSMPHLIAEATPEAVAAWAEVTPEEVLAWQDKCQSAMDTVPQPGTRENRIDEGLAAMAVYIASNRHCGTYESAYTPAGEVFLQEGKDLTKVEAIIGSGGSIIHSSRPGDILKQSLYTPALPNVLKPAQARMYLDKDNIFAAMGLLGRIDPDAAVEIMLKNFIEVQ